ncbi:hypothetical protein ACERII_13020 [Evansella sp. AB-rgal1]|uniref:hypothetical protein n=1 Tax=Evansella sp. AB-rgal1 TaxID=3242696 RepID=UPI00359DD98A
MYSKLRAISINKVLVLSIYFVLIVSLILYLHSIAHELLQYNGLLSSLLQIGFILYIDR